MKRFAGAVAGLLLAGHAAAGGWDPTAAAVPDSQDLNISGATASEIALRDFIIGTLCDAGGADIRMYSLNGSYTFNSNQFAIACSVATVPGADKNILFRKEGAGGSYKGVAPVCNNSELRSYIIPTAAACGAVTTANVAGENGRIVDVYACNNLGSGASLLEAEGGFSDLGPTEGLVDTSSTCDNVTRAYVVPFGVMVTKKLRDALQIAQNIRPCAAVVAGTRCVGANAAGNPVDSGWAARDDDGDGVINEEEADHQPSFSNSLITSLNTGTVPRWSDIAVYDPNNQGVLTPLNNIVGLGALDPDVAANYEACPGGVCVAPVAADNRVTLVHRALSSGTRAETAVVMNREKCVSGARGLTSPTPLDFAGPTTMQLQSGSGDMERTMTNLNRGVNANTGFTTAPMNVSDGGSLWAFGHTSLDRVPVGPDKNAATTTGDGFRFIRLDGRLGTFENVANGSYYHYGESTIQWENDLNANELSLMSTLSTGSGNPTVLGSLRRQHSWGFSGVMSLDCPTTVTDGATGVVSYNNVLPSTGLTRGGNNCQVATLSSACDFVLETNADNGSPGATEQDSDVTDTLDF